MQQPSCLCCSPQVVPWLKAPHFTHPHHRQRPQVYAIDGFDNTAAAVGSIKAKGGYPVCYISAGTWENWRPDASKFLSSDKGKSVTGWQGEKWLNIRSDNVKTIMRARMQMCKDKGFVAVDPDNVDGYTNSNGLALTAADQLSYNAWLADTAHSLGLAVGLKNDLSQILQLAPKFDFAINEACQRYAECGLYSPMKAAGKPVWNVEYSSKTFSAACLCQATYGVMTIQKTTGLDAWRAECASATTTCGSSSAALTVAGVSSTGDGGEELPSQPPPRHRVTRRYRRRHPQPVGGTAGRR